jgi:hypothetical protein
MKRLIQVPPGRRNLLPLPLLVAGVGTDDVHDPLAPHYLAVLADLLHAGADFHGTALTVVSVRFKESDSV